MRSKWDRAPEKSRIDGETGASSGGSRCIVPKLRCLTVPMLCGFVFPIHVEQGQKVERSKPSCATGPRPGSGMGGGRGRGRKLTDESWMVASCRKVSKGGVLISKDTPTLRCWWTTSVASWRPQHCVSSQWLPAECSGLTRTHEVDSHRRRASVGRTCRDSSWIDSAIARDAMRVWLEEGVDRVRGDIT